jgi:hypothetical protein
VSALFDIMLFVLISFDITFDFLFFDLIKYTTVALPS